MITYAEARGGLKAAFFLLLEGGDGTAWPVALAGSFCGAAEWLSGATLLRGTASTGSSMRIHTHVVAARQWDNL